MQRAFLAAKGEKPKREPKSRATPKRTRVKQSSAKQDVRQAFLAGVKAERLLTKQSCEDCGLVPMMGGLDLHHATTKRSQGHGYDPRKGPGADDPAGLVLLCRPCHQAAESAPEWST